MTSSVDASLGGFNISMECRNDDLGSVFNFRKLAAQSYATNKKVGFLGQTLSRGNLTPDYSFASPCGPRPPRDSIMNCFFNFD